ncbi:MAG: response regulator [Clostridia bacterium]|nr:response regulator [Clostridia bacterium]
MGKNKKRKNKIKKEVDVSRKYTWIIGLLIFVLGIIIALFTFNMSSELIISQYDNAFTNVINSTIETQNKTINDFQIMGIAVQTKDNFEQVDKMFMVIENDFSNYDAVGFVRNGIIEKTFGTNSKVNVGDSIDKYYGKILRTYDTPSGVETFNVCQNPEGDIISVIQSPAYIYEENTTKYLGEYFAIINYSSLARSAFKGQNLPVIVDINVGDDNYYPIFQSVSKISGQEYDFVFDKKKTGYDVTYTVRIKKWMLTPGIVVLILKFIEAAFIAGAASFVIRYLIINYNKNKEENMIRETKYDFVTNVIYEIRTSTNSIISYLSNVGDNVSDAVKENIEASRKELDKLLHKINNMLDITNIRWSNFGKYDEQYYMTVLIDEITYEYKDKITDLDIQWLVDIADSLPIKFKGHKNSIKKMLEHVINNSLKLMVDGHIKISVYGAYTTPKEEKMRVNFVISDTGIGMKDENINDIYKPSNAALYLEGNSMEEAKTELFIAKEICKSLDGDFKVTSEYGKGTIVTCSIIQDVTDKRIMTQELLEGLEEKFRKNLGKLKSATANVLVVDDNEVNLSMMANLISKYGCTVETAKSGEIAALLCAEKEFDLMFIDQLMPGLDGFETLKEIRNYKVNKNTPAVLVTANTYDKDSAFEESGFEELIFKPLSVNDVEKILKLLLPIECITCQEVDN